MTRKLYIAIVLLVILCVATAAIIYTATQLSAPKPVVSGVNIGDTFTYSLKGISTLTGLDAVDTPSFSQYNETDYYKVTITDVNGSSVSLDTIWRFTNGTEINDNQTIDLSNGKKPDQNTGFWAVYASNLNKNDLLRPTGYDGLIVNNTDTKTYADSTREINIWSIENQFFDMRDPTYGTQRYDYIRVYFDKQTGMLESLNNYSEYNNPAMTEVITWKLTNSTVWAVQ